MNTSGPGRSAVLYAAVGLALCSSFCSKPLLAATASEPVSTRSLALPLFFEPAGLDKDRCPSFVARGANYLFSIKPSELSFCLRRPDSLAEQGNPRQQPTNVATMTASRVVRLTFVGANAEAAVAGTAEFDGKANYLLGNDPAQWRAQVPIYGGVRVSELYPGVQLSYYGTQHQLEYDFVVSPNADPSIIQLRFDGADKLSINTEGELVIALDDSDLHQHRPVMYQMIRGARHEVSGHYVIRESNTAGFEIGAYDPNWPLIIDPVFSYSTYFGGNAADTALAIKVDRGGSVYLAGRTLSTKFPTASIGNPVQGSMHGGTQTGDAFVAKLDNTGSKLLYFTYLGGTSDDAAYDLAIDASGNAYITGFTVSPDFPTKNALFSHISGSADPKFGIYPVEAFVAELNPSGSALVFSTYLGGDGNDVGSAIAVDPAGNIYVTGYTYSTNFPTRNPHQSSLGGNDDAFVSKFAPGGRSLVYSTYLGGIAIDEGEGIAADAQGYAYVSGYTASTNFPVTSGAYSTNLNGSGVAVSVYDAFVTKIAPLGGRFVYSTYLGGSQNDFGYRIAVDTAGNAFLTGGTQSADFPHTNAFNLTLGNNGTNAVNFDAFLSKLDVNGKPVYSAQFGGTANDSGWDVAVDPLGRPFVIGITHSTNFPARNTFDLFRRVSAGNNDVFVVAFEANAAPVLYSGYFGGYGDDFGYAIAVDQESSAYISGATHSSNLPLKAGALQKALSGSSDAFLAKIRLADPMLNVQVTNGLFQVSWPATAPDYQLQSTADLSAPQVWNSVLDSPVLSQGQYLVNIPATNSATLFRLLHR